MIPLSTIQKEELLSRLFWDTKTNKVDFEELIYKKVETIDDTQSQQFFVRLLTSCDWYTLIKLIPPDKLKAILAEPVLNRLFPKDLQQKYIYVRDILSKRTLSIPG